jgi:hypothetical protein
MQKPPLNDAVVTAPRRKSVLDFGQVQLGRVDRPWMLSWSRRLYIRYRQNAWRTRLGLGDIPAQ